MMHPVILVVGPSGSGKDTLLREALAQRPDFHLVRRTITRPADAGGEDHHAVSYEEFAGLEVEGAFALSWEAHGLSYGIPNSELERRATGPILVNASRGVIDEARERFGPLTVFVVTASLEILSQRLHSRRREDNANIVRRLERARMAMPTGEDVITIDNSGPLTAGVSAVVNALDALQKGYAS